MGNGESIPLTHPLEPELEAIAKRSHAVYAMFWVETGGVLRIEAAFHRPDRVTVFREDEVTYTQACHGVTIDPGVGPVGRAYLSEGAELASAETLPASMACVAKEFRIRSIACMPWNGGVLEVGTDRRWKQMPAMLPSGLGAAPSAHKLDNMWVSDATTQATYFDRQFSAASCQLGHIPEMAGVSS